MPALGTKPVVGSTGTWPEVKTRSPTRTPLDQGPRTGNSRTLILVSSDTGPPFRFCDGVDWAGTSSFDTSCVRVQLSMTQQVGKMREADNSMPQKVIIRRRHGHRRRDRSDVGSPPP